VPLKVKWDDCRTAGFDREQVVALFREMEFRSLIERLPGGPSRPDTTQQMRLFEPEKANSPVNKAPPFKSSQMRYPLP